MERKKITLTIFGFGNVGRQIANILINDSSYRLDINVMEKDKDCIGAYVDLCHASKVTNLHELFLNDSTLIEKSDYIFHCAGKGVSKKGDRLEVAAENKEITRKLFFNQNLKPSANMIVITNPVDTITYYSWKYSSLNAKNVIGVGTYLDSLRMNHYVQEELNDYSLNVSSVFMGEHGFSSVFIDSLSTINNLPFGEFLNAAQIKNCIQKTVLAAQRIKETQEATVYGASACAVDVFKKMSSNSEAVLPVSVVLSETNQKRFSCPEIAMSVLCTFLESGALQHEKIRLSEEEVTDLKASASILEKVID